MPDFDLDDVYPPPPVRSTERILPDDFLPMLPTAAAGPLDSRDHAYEPRWEGLRVLVGLEGPTLVMRTAAGQDPSFWFPEAARIREAAQPEWVLLDGEFVVRVEGRVSQPALRRRLAARHAEEVSRLAAEWPATFIASDVLRIGDSWLLDVTWDERRDILTRVLRPVPGVELSPAAAEAAEAQRLARAQGLEAVTAKRLKGRYSPGERTRDWLNLRPVEIVEAVICGWIEGRGARGGTIGSLLLGRFEGGELRYIGHTGTGIDAATLPYLHRELQRRARRRCPFPNEPTLSATPHWVRPELVCRIRHQGWTETGRMRSPTFLGLAGLGAGERVRNR